MNNSEMCLKNKSIMVVDDDQNNADHWKRILKSLGARVQQFIGPDITDLRPRVVTALLAKQYDGVVLDVLFPPSVRDGIADNRLAGIFLWESVESDITGAGGNPVQRSGPVLLNTKNDNGDLAIRSVVDAFCAARPSSDVCWSANSDDRIGMARLVFS